jgi:hypothetical protein
MADDQSSHPASEVKAGTPAKKSAAGKSKQRKNAKKAKAMASLQRRRGRKPYQVIPFEQALRIGQGIADFGAGHPMKRKRS